MRNKIDYGIDLGTTNSAIARMENGVPTIKKSDTLKDTFPSCIHFNKKRDAIVGDAAYNIMKNESARALQTFNSGETNTFIEFKRTMGKTHSYECRNMKKHFSPEELSAEVLKKLKSVIQDENISSIVITVPAKFLTPQKEATINAAQLLGFKHVELLQEPIAAATAYGLSSKNKNGFWLVFDFGGGTFDAALVKAEEGILSVKDTDGDNWLGGKDLDEAIVDQIIIPNLAQNYAIESVLNDAVKKNILRTAVKFHAEDAKIALSFKDSHNILTNLNDLPFEDDNGDEPEIDVLVTQADMETVVAPIFQKAINISKDLLKRNNLKGTDLGALILVGGPTYSPILRRMLKAQISDKIDTNIDPMTIVAKGAALFASTITVSEEVKAATRDNTKLQLELGYEATSVELVELVNIKVLKDKTIGSFPAKIYADIVRSDGAWSSGKKLIGEKAALIDVSLVEGRSNAFQINVYDEAGNKLACEPNQFSILQGIDIGDMTTLPYNIGIGKFFSTEGKDLFMPAKGLEKNRIITKEMVGQIDFLKTRSAIRPGMIKDIIRIPIYQGAYHAKGSNLVLNDWVADVIITGESMPALLPVDSDVNITIKVDRSEQMKFTAHFPLLNYTTDEYVIKIKRDEVPTAALLTQEITKAKREARQVNAGAVTANLEDLEAQLENEGASADGKLKIQDNLRKELLKLDEAQKTAKWPKIVQALKDTFYELEDLVQKIKGNNDTDDLNMNKIEAHLQDYRRNIEHTIENKDIKTAKEMTEEMEGLHRELLNGVTGGSLDKSRIEYHDREFNNLKWKDKNKARQLVNQGLKLIAEGKTNQLKPVLHQIWDLRIDPEDERDTTTLR